MTFDTNSVVPANDHINVTDALLRFGAGVDGGDSQLLATAFGDDAVVDFGPYGRQMGLDFPFMTGRETIIRFLGATAQTQTPAAVLTNTRKA